MATELCKVKKMLSPPVRGRRHALALVCVATMLEQ